MSKNKTNSLCAKFLSKTSLLMVLLVLNLLLPVNSKIYFLEADFYQDKTQDKKIILGKGEVIISDKPVSRVAVSDPNVIDVQVLNEKEIFTRAKQLGLTTVLIWEKGNTKPSRFDVEVWPDINYLTKQLQELDKNIIVEYIPPSSSPSSGASSQSQNPLGGASEPTASGQSVPSGQPTSGQPASSTSSSSSSQLASGRIILKGDVANAEVIARSLQIAGAYVDDQGIKIISQPGGQVVDGLSGKYDIYSNSDAQTSQSGQGSATAFGARDPIRFTSNRYANLSRSVIATTQMGAVISFLTVKDAAQISVAIRFYEISRSAARNLGFNAIAGGSTLQGGTFVGGNGISQPIGGVASIANLMSFMAASGQSAAEFSLQKGLSIAGGSFLAQAIGQGVTGVIFNPDNGIGAVIQALQERGEIKTLAEPNLVIANGEPASFLAGGEVPIVRSVFTAGGASQDVTYEPFGIKFSLLPTLTSQDKIFLQLIPEIRDIDTDLSNLVVPPGSTSVRPPAFRTRRTQTQVELYSGQAFAISGLLREDNTRNLRKVPGVGDIPVLGTLFRSKSFRKGQTELLVVVSPIIIRPTDPNKIAQFTKPEIPYNEFNQMPPLKPHINLEDEKGPDMKEPIDANKYNNPQSMNEPEKKSFDKPAEETKKITESNKEPIQENSETVSANQALLPETKSPTIVDSKVKEEPASQVSEPVKKQEQNETIDQAAVEKKSNEVIINTNSNKEANLPETNSIQKQEKSENLQQSNKTSKSQWSKFKERFIRNAESEQVLKERTSEELISKKEKKKLTMGKKQIKIAKKLEEEKLNKEKEQTELYTYQQTLKENWKKEIERYEQAKEAMRLARENK